MPKNNPPKVYSKNSVIPNIGKGLFAKIKINKGSIITEFKGKLRKPGEHASSSRSNIYFNDECFLECPETDLASFANDPINFTKDRRKLMKALRSTKPFYRKNPNTKINAEIEIKDKSHRAFLIASDDIMPDEEIFCHYGFLYWFKIEITRIGFLQEDEIEKNGFPEKIFEYPAFLSYVKEFYPTYISHEIKPYGDVYDFIVHLQSGHHVLMPIENFASQITRVPVEDADKVLQNC